MIRPIPDLAAVRLVTARPARAGLVVSGKVGNSVVRHRVSRRLRAQLRPLLAELPPVPTSWSGRSRPPRTPTAPCWPPTSDQHCVQRCSAVAGDERGRTAARGTGSTRVRRRTAGPMPSSPGTSRPGRLVRSASADRTHPLLPALHLPRSAPDLSLHAVLLGVRGRPRWLSTVRCGAAGWRSAGWPGAIRGTKGVGTRSPPRKAVRPPAPAGDDPERAPRDVQLLLAGLHLLPGLRDHVGLAQGLRFGPRRGQRLGLGAVVVFLIFTLRAILFKPFMKQMDSQLKMQAIQPEMKKIREKYKDDRQRLVRRDDEAEQGGRGQPAGRLSAGAGAGAGVHRAVPRAAQVPAGAAAGGGLHRRSLLLRRGRRAVLRATPSCSVGAPLRPFMTMPKSELDAHRGIGLRRHRGRPSR